MQRQHGTVYQILRPLEIEARLEEMIASGDARGVEHLPERGRTVLRREPLPPDAGVAGHLERGAALIDLEALSAAPRIERAHELIAKRPLKAQLVDP